MGIRKKALIDSLKWIEWDQAHRQNGFSNIRRRSRQYSNHGAFQRLGGIIALGIEAWHAQSQTSAPSITVISGTATAIDPAQKFPFQRLPFRATSMSLKEKTALIQSYLDSMNAETKDVAILAEGGTSFGLSTPNRSQDDPRGTTHGKENPADESLHLQFPLHISDLRGALKAASGSASSEYGLRNRNLSFSEDQSSVGRVQYRPSLHVQPHTTTNPQLNSRKHTSKANKLCRDQSDRCGRSDFPAQRIRSAVLIPC